MNFSQYYNLKKGHNNLDFFDIDLYKDNKIFIDPSLIDTSTSNWCRECSFIINSFFDTVLECYKKNDTNKLFQILNCGHEPNETKFGMSSGKPMGKGTSSKGLFDIFKDILNRNLLNNNLIKKPMDLCVFVHNFAEDRMSDLITNILRRKLNDFTISQCKFYNIKLSIKPINIGKSWNPVSKKWNDTIVNTLLLYNSPIILVPKKIVRQRYIYSAGEYLNKKILEHRQNYHVKNRTALSQIKFSKKRGEYISPPSKKTIREKEIYGIKEKNYITNYTLKYPNLITEFREDTMRKISMGKYILKNDELDDIAYKN